MRDKRAGCTGKDKLTSHQAKQIRNRMAKRRRIRRGLTIYCCKHCGHWHIGGKK